MCCITTGTKPTLFASAEYIKKSKPCDSLFSTGVAGFGPANAAVKVLCLTA